MTLCSRVLPDETTERDSAIPGWYVPEDSFESTPFLVVEIRIHISEIECRLEGSEVDVTGRYLIYGGNPTLDALFSIFGILGEEESAELTEAMREVRERFSEDMRKRLWETSDDSS